MRVTFISHASVVIECGDVVLWTDPWLFGRCFNNSWALWPEPSRKVILPWLPRITHLWISHEHPDHFHLPTLQWLPDEFKTRVELLFQKLHTDKMVTAFQQLGFSNVRTLNHREHVRLTDSASFYLYQEAPMDSACALTDLNLGCTVLNLNDINPGPIDRRVLRRDLKSIDLLLNQFSFATYDGRLDVETIATRYAKQELERMHLDHEDLGAEVTIPIASFMYFCRSDNAYLNQYVNTVQDVADHFKAMNLELVILRPGDSHTLGEHHDKTSALDYYKKLDDEEKRIDPTEIVLSESLEEAAKQLFKYLTDHYPKLLLSIVGRIRVLLPDLNCCYNLDFGRASIERTSNLNNWDLRANSQPFFFALKNPYGFQTLSIAGRFAIRNAEKRFLLLRMILALGNSEIYLKPRYLFSLRFIAFIARNAPSLLHQFVSRIRVFWEFVS